MTKYYENERFKELTDQLMKPSGKSDTVSGELIRAVNRICGRYSNDGDKIGCGYGNETCNAAGRYIFMYGNTEMRDVINLLWNGRIKDTSEAMGDTPYELLLSLLVEETVKYLDSGADELNKETPDMYNFALDIDKDYDFDED